MQAKEYMKRVLETESKPETLHISSIGLDIVMEMSIAHAEVMNYLKRAVFYGKPIERDALAQSLGNIVGISQMLRELVIGDALQDDNVTARLVGPSDQGGFVMPDVARINKRLLHGVIGEASENGEKIEALRKQLNGEPLDLVNFAEEIGDVNWYDAIQKDELQNLANNVALHDEANADGEVRHVFSMGEEDIRARNIAKLEARNKGRKFDAEATLNRDLAAERTILEGTAK